MSTNGACDSSFTISAMLFDTPFRPQPGTPLHRQLYHHLQQAILAGELRSAARLPPSRTLAAELGVSRNTVLSAYEQLRAEGYLETLGGSGTFVAEIPPDGFPHRVLTGSAFPEPHLSAFAHEQLRTPALNASPGLRTPFSISTPALGAFPHKLWAQLASRQARKLSASDLSYGDPAGYRPLREAVAAHVTISRQVHCTAEQVVIVSGAQGALTLASRLLLNPGDAVWLEDPGYLGARAAFLAAGARVVPVPLDAEGLIVSQGVARAAGARLAYVTPSHQLPLGMALSMARRLALLAWAKRAGAYILEDDYDSEYRYGERPLAALQTLDEAGRVIYVGSFSKVLFPALRLGFLVLPPPLVRAALAVRGSLDGQPPALEQRVLTAFIREGHYARHLRRTRKLYAEKRAALLGLLAPLPLTVDAPPAGLHCVGWLPEGLDERQVIQRAAEAGLELWPVSAYCLEPLERQGILLGYASADREVMEDGVHRLAGALEGLQGSV